MISFFDLDNTLLKGNASFRFGVYLFKRGYIPFYQVFPLFLSYFFHSVGLLPVDTLHDLACRACFRSKPLQEIQEYVEAFLDEYFESLLYFQVTQKLIHAHQEGHHTVILSTSPDFLVGAIARRLGVLTWCGTEYATDSNGCITHVEKYLTGEAKALYLRSLCHNLNIPIEKTVAYSDSFRDLPFLQASGIPKGVNPDRKLRKFCLANDWEII